MLNGLWAGMILLGIIWGAVTGNLAAVTEGILGGVAEAVELCVSMLGILCFWSGIMEVATRSRLLEALTRRLGPMMDFLFPTVPKEHPARESMATNLVANFLGLGWAATPAGLRAMADLAKLSKTPGRATNAMCTFLVLNMSSIQLIPMTVLAYRKEYGSLHPALITAPALVTTAVGTLAAVIFCKRMQGRGERSR